MGGGNMVIITISVMCVPFAIMIAEYMIPNSTTAPTAGQRWTEGRMKDKIFAFLWGIAVGMNIARLLMALEYGL